MRSRGFIIAAALLTASLLSTSCYRHQIVFQDSSPGAVVVPRATVHDFFIIGLIGVGGPISMDAVCPEGTAHIALRAGLVHLVVAALTSGLVTARASHFSCQTGAYYGAAAPESVEPSGPTATRTGPAATAAVSGPDASNPASSDSSRPSTHAEHQ